MPSNSSTGPAERADEAVLRAQAAGGDVAVAREERLAPGDEVRLRRAFLVCLLEDL